jgi:DNA repair protein RecN (Recombination protein N)
METRYQGWLGSGDQAVLEELLVENFGIISSLKWRLTSGLNVLTGETGAGKSLIVDAIEALLGGRVGQEVVRDGVGNLRIEGVFGIDGGSSLKELLSDYELDGEGVVVLTREIGKGEPGFGRVNGRAVSLRVLRHLGRGLVDIHGQSDHLSLNDTEQQLALIDRYASARDLRSEVESRVERLQKLGKELVALTQGDRETERRVELLRFQVEEIRRAEVRIGEDDELQKESGMLRNIEKLKTLSQSAYQAVYKGDGSAPSAIDRLGEAVGSLKDLVQSDAGSTDLLKDAESALYLVEDISRALRTYYDQLEHDPARLELVEQRLDLVRDLKRKYGGTISEIIEYAADAEKELNHVSLRAEARAQLREECEALKKEIGTLGYQLSKVRHDAAAGLTREIERELGQLNMAEVGFRVLFSELETRDQLVLPDGRGCGFAKSGIDKVEFQVTTNPGEPLKPLAKIASTGETSRLMLAIKSALSRVDATPTLVFDEIDMGIGGRSGEAVGRKLSNLSRGHQVICVTHLPQVAAFADSHYYVHKRLADNRASASISTLSGKERLEEISAMLGSLSEPALESAQELLERAQAWKRSQIRGEDI